MSAFASGLLTILRPVLGAAQELLEKLSGERKRWDQTMKQLSAATSALAGNALLSAGFLVYLADEAEAVRACDHRVTTPGDHAR